MTRIKPVPVDLGFEQVSLLYDFNALAEVTEILTPAELAALEGGAGKVTLKTIRAMIWAGVLHERPAVSIMEVGRMIDPSKLEDIGLQMAAALENHMPKPKAGGGADEENPTTGTDGLNSGLSVVSTAA